jgi:hypothetical protein
VKPAAGYRGPLAYSSPEAVQTTGTVAQLRTRRDSNPKTTTPEDDTILMTLALAGLGLDKLIEQGNSQVPEIIRERQYDLDDGARSLTNDVAGRWGQSPYRVEFRCDGQKFSPKSKRRTKILE